MAARRQAVRKKAATRGKTARAAAAGWGGDRFVALDLEGTPAAAPMVVGLVAWDTERDAREFESVFRTYLERKKAGDHLLERKRSRIVFATHMGETDPKRVSQAAWKTFKVSKPPKGKSKVKDRGKQK